MSELCPKCQSPMPKHFTHGFGCGSYIEWDSFAFVQTDLCRLNCCKRELDAALAEVERLKGELANAVVS